MKKTFRNDREFLSDVKKAQEEFRDGAKKRLSKAKSCYSIGIKKRREFLQERYPTPDEHIRDLDNIRIDIVDSCLSDWQLSNRPVIEKTVDENTCRHSDDDGENTHESIQRKSVDLVAAPRPEQRDQLVPVERGVSDDVDRNRGQAIRRIHQIRAGAEERISAHQSVGAGAKKRISTHRAARRDDQRHLHTDAKIEHNRRHAEQIAAAIGRIMELLEALIQRVMGASTAKPRLGPAPR
ncbi:MAG: hypothetical protein V7752_20140 [Halopseudomonas sp.]